MLQKIKQLFNGREEQTGLDRTIAEQAADITNTGRNVEAYTVWMAEYDAELAERFNKAHIIQNIPEAERRELLRQSINDLTIEDDRTLDQRRYIFRTALTYAHAQDIRGLRGEQIDLTGAAWEKARPARVLELYDRMIDHESEADPATSITALKQDVTRKAAHLLAYEQDRIERLQGQAFDITAKARAIQDLEQKATLASLRGYNIEATEAELASATEAYSKMRQEIRAAREDIRHSIEDRATLADMTDPDTIKNTLHGQEREKALAAYSAVQAEREQEQARSRDREQGAGWGD